MTHKTQVDYLKYARQLLDEAAAFPASQPQAWMSKIEHALAMTLSHLEGMEAVTNSQTVAQETTPSVECPNCTAANNPDNRNCAHCRASLFGVTQETTTDAPACPACPAWPSGKHFYQTPEVSQQDPPWSITVACLCGLKVVYQPELKGK